MSNHKRGIYSPRGSATPDATITRLENNMQPNTGSGPLVPTSAVRFPVRTSYASTGKSTVMHTNHFAITELSKTPTYYRYKVDAHFSASQAAPRGQKLRELFKHIVQRPDFSNIDWASDYTQIIVTTTKLDTTSLQSVTFDPPPRRAGAGNQTNGSGSSSNHPVHQITQSMQNMTFAGQAQTRNRIIYSIQQTSTFNLNDMTTYLQSESLRRNDFPGRVDIVPLLNIITCKSPNAADNNVAKGPNQKLYPFGTHPLAESSDLGDNLIALRGFYASVRPAVGRLILNLNNTAGAFYKPEPLANMVKNVNVNDSSRCRQQEAFIKGLKIEVDYGKSKRPVGNKIKTVFGLGLERPHSLRFGNARQVTFNFQAPGQAMQATSVYRYFQIHHGITLQQPDTPVINCGTAADPQYIPVELCTVLPGQQYRKPLQADQTTKMLAFAALPPQANAESIVGRGLRFFGLTSTDDSAPSTEPFGFRVQPKLLAVPALILPQPTLSYRNNQNKEVKCQPTLGSWKFENMKFHTTKGETLKVQVIIVAAPSDTRHRQQVQDMAQGFLATLKSMLEINGVRIEPSRPMDMVLLNQYFRPENRKSNTDKLEQAFKNAKANGARLLVTVTPLKDKWLYSRIKFLGDVKVGIHTINITANKMKARSDDESFASNISLKFNLKTGGMSHRVEKLVCHPVDASTMVVGVDVTHPAPGNAKDAPSVSAVVASIDADFFQYPGSLRVQGSRQEMVADLKDMVVERLRLWNQINSSLPKKILVYRDGVSEGQYEQILTIELPQFQAAFAEVYATQEPLPKVTIVVVGKRHHVRFYPAQKEDAAGRNSNPRSGTVVDRSIVGKHLYEFYLQAQDALVGTARPAHYVVIKDDIGFSANQLVDFTFKLSFAFNRAPKAISRCPPADYADRLCERARLYLYDQLTESNPAQQDGITTAEMAARVKPHDDINKVTWYM